MFEVLNMGHERVIQINMMWRSIFLNKASTKDRVRIHKSVCSALHEVGPETCSSPHKKRPIYRISESVKLYKDALKGFLSH
jgi:hypothetical protein